MLLRLSAVLIAFATTATADVPKVATDILPVHSLVARVMQGAGAPDLILPPGASPHGYAMRPSEAAALERADVVFWIGKGLTPWLADPIETLASDAQVFALLDQEGTLLNELHDHEGDDHDGHDHGDVDPHAWLDPENGRVWIGHIAEALAVADPDNAELYRANAKAADSEIDGQTKEMQSLLAPFRSQKLGVYQDAFGYLESRFGIEPSFALLSSDADKPSPRRIAQLRDLAQKEAVSVIVTEPQTSQALVRTIFEGVNVTQCQIDILGSQIEPGPNHYWALLQNLAADLGQCGTVSSGTD